MKKEKLYKKDEELFDNMVNHYISNNEKVFFETQRYKQEYVETEMNDLVLCEDSNEEGIYIVRVSFGEYLVGLMPGDEILEEFHVMTLSEALAINLKELGCPNLDMTLLEWLRARDYKDVLYDHNYDDLM